jgi:hypothetical protein
MMKKLLVVLTVLAMASVASAALQISVNGVVNPADEIFLKPSETAVIDIWGDGQTACGAFYLFVQNGPTSGGSLDESQAVMLYQGNATFLGPGTDPTDYEWIRDAGYAMPCDVVYMELVDLAVPAKSLTGTLVDNIIFHCESQPGDVVLWLVDAGDPTIVLDTQVIHQIPEPMTLALLGLGGLFLRRRK